ncbi:MAG: lytic transglycosylase domain-containing protein [Acidobacteriota bacterium]
MLLIACGMWAPAASAQYLAVFVDGRTLQVSGTRLLDDSRIRLEVEGGGAIEVPLARLERVIEDAVEPEPAAIAAPPCRAEFEDEALPATVPFSAEIVAASRAANLHPWLVAAIVEAESASNPRAISRVGARGLMQLMPAVWLEQGVVDPHEPRANLLAGARHLRAMLDRFGKLTLALAAYNSGATTVERAGGIPPYLETRAYVRAVLGKFCPASPAG